MAEIVLIPIDQEVVAAAEQGAASLEQALDVRLGAYERLVSDVIQRTLGMLAVAPRSAPWGGYLVVDRTSRAVVGTCAFKHGPGRDGRVEIAYYTFPSFEGKGYASAMADSLLEIARAAPAARVVSASTLPERNASTRVLEKLGFAWKGQDLDPEEGPVWRWESRLR